MLEGLTPFSSTRYTIFCKSVFVLPEPAPANTKNRIRKNPNENRNFFVYYQKFKYYGSLSYD